MDFVCKKKYEVKYRGCVLNKTFVVPCRFYGGENESCYDATEYFEMFGLDVKRAIEKWHIVLRDGKCVNKCRLNVHEGLTKEDQDIRILEIEDIAVGSPFRKRGIGAQLMDIIEGMARDNKCRYIVGELQGDSDEEPLDRRKSFFAKEGFEILRAERSDLSGWVVRKKIY